VRTAPYAEPVHKAFPTGQTLDLGNLPEYWRVVDDAFDQLEALPSLSANRVLSARAFDEAQPAGLRTYMEATRYLTVARDNHEALLALLKHHGATLWAPWSLLRPTFETAFLAAWILDPEDGRERRARGLRCEIRDAREQRKHRAAFKAFPEVRHLIEDGERAKEANAIATYKDEARALGRNFDRLDQPINVTDELHRLSFVAAAPGTGPFLEATWRQLSGYEHGFGWALISGSDKEVTAEIPGGVDMKLVINDEAFVTAAKSTYLLLIMACRAFRRRHQEPSQ